MENRLFSFIFAVWLMGLALILRAQRKTQVAAVRTEERIAQEINIPGYSFSRN